MNQSLASTRTVTLILAYMEHYNCKFVSGRWRPVLNLRCLREWIDVPVPEIRLVQTDRWHGVRPATPGATRQRPAVPSARSKWLMVSWGICCDLAKRSAEDWDRWRPWRSWGAQQKGVRQAGSMSLGNSKILARLSHPYRICL